MGSTIYLFPIARVRATNLIRTKTSLSSHIRDNILPHKMETFHLFPQFPYDIRHHIWLEALAGATHRVHTLYLSGCRACYSKEESMPHNAALWVGATMLSPSSETTMSPRRVAAVCSESRSIATALLPDTLDIHFSTSYFKPRQNGTGKPGIFRFNSATDVICFETHPYPNRWSPCYRFKNPGTSLLQLSSIPNMAFDLRFFSTWDLYFLPLFSALRRLYLILWDPRNPGFEHVLSKWEVEGAEDGKHLTGSDIHPKRYIVLDRTQFLNSVFGKLDIWSLWQHEVGDF